MGLTERQYSPLCHARCLNPFIAAQRRLIARGSCSTMLLRYLAFLTAAQDLFLGEWKNGG
jgi:hypothetical protein